MFPVHGWPISQEELSFVQSLLTDLRPLGFEICLQGKHVRITQIAPNSMHCDRQFYYEAHRALHRKSLAEKWDAIVDFETKYGPSVFIQGQQLNLSAIDPRLRPVDLRRKANPAPRDCAIVEYVRSYQTVASRRSVGRENVYILEDHGHSNLPVMGVLVLASPRYYQPHRDEVLGWLSPTDLGRLSVRRQKRWQKIRLAGLNRTMQVAICCALPPYSRLGAASLLAVAPFMPNIQLDFQQRWYDKKFNRDPDLAAVATTTSMGLTGTPFQALYTTMFFDEKSSVARGEKWNANNTLYARLGRWHPWLPNVSIQARDPRARFQSLVSKQTLNLALAVAGPEIVPKHREWILQEASSQLRMRVFQYALDRVGLSTGIFYGNPVGVLLGALDKPSLEALQEGKPRETRPVLSWEKAVVRFRSEYEISKTRLCRDAEHSRAVQKRAQRALQTTFDDILLSSSQR
jgi:hypothetical protein